MLGRLDRVTLVTMSTHSPLKGFTLSSLKQSRRTAVTTKVPGQVLYQTDCEVAKVVETRQRKVGEKEGRREEEEEEGISKQRALDGKSM